MIKCCKGCIAPKRHPGCHDHCPEYIEEKEQHEKEKALMRQKDAVNHGLCQQTFYVVNRANKRRGAYKRKK